MSHQPPTPQIAAKKLGEEIADFIDIANKWNPADGQPGLSKEVLWNNLASSQLAFVGGTILTALITRSPSLSESLANLTMVAPDYSTLYYKLCKDRSASAKHEFVDSLRSRSERLIGILHLILLTVKPPPGSHNDAFIHAALFLMNELIVVHRKAIGGLYSDYKKTHLPTNDTWSEAHTDMASHHPQWAKLTLDQAHTDFAKHPG